MRPVMLAPLSFRPDEPTLEMLDSLCRKMKLTRSEVVRISIRDSYLANDIATRLARRTGRRAKA